MEDKTLYWYFPSNFGDMPPPFSVITGNKWFSVLIGEEMYLDIYFDKFLKLF